MATVGAADIKKPPKIGAEAVFFLEAGRDKAQ